MIHLGGRWTRVQLNALYREGWITHHELHTMVIDITVLGDSCRWFMLSSLITRAEELRGH